MRRLFGCLLVLLGLGWSQANAAVALDNCEAASVSLNNSTSVTDNGFTIGAGSNQLLVVMVAAFGSSGVWSATWNGVSMTNVADIANGSNPRAVIFALKAPAQGNKSLVINSTVNFQFGNSIACSYNNVDQTTPTQNSNTSTGGTANSSLAITTSNGNATAFSGGGTGGYTAISPGQLYVNNGNGTGAAQSLSSGASTTYSSTESGNFAFAGIDIKASTGGGATCNFQRPLTGAGC